MNVFNIIFTGLFVFWLFITAWIGWRILTLLTKLVSALMDTVIRASDAAKQSSENAQRVVAILQEQLQAGRK